MQIHHKLQRYHDIVEYLHIFLPSKAEEPFPASLLPDDLHKLAPTCHWLALELCFASELLHLSSFFLDQTIWNSKQIIWSLSAIIILNFKSMKDICMYITIFNQKEMHINIYWIKWSNRNSLYSNLFQIIICQW